MDLKYVTGPITKADAGGLEAVISTPKVDKDAESVDPLGLVNRDEWLTNPLVYWAHEWARDPGAEPIGKGTSLEVTKDAIRSTAVFAPTPKAQNVRALVQGGFVRKTSIGFDSLLMADVGGIPTHVSWALREWSIVPMPANTDAVVTGVKSALRWLADEIAEPIDESDAGQLTALSAADLAALVDKAVAEHLALTAKDDEAIALVEERTGHRLAVLRRPRYAVVKATWSTAYVNALPDSAFACIDATGRHYPHHNDAGTLDLPHLRAALSRIGDTSNAQCGRRHLEAHARAEGIGDR